MENNVGTNPNPQGLDAQNPVNPNNMGFNSGVDTNSFSENSNISNTNNTSEFVSEQPMMTNSSVGIEGNTASNFGASIVNPVPVDNGMGNGMMGESPNKNKKILLLSLIIGIVVFISLVGVVGYKIAMSSPKVIFKNSIKAVFKGVNRSIDEVEKYRDILDIENNAIVFRGDIKADIKFDDLEELKELRDRGINISDYSFGAEVGFDLKNELIQGNVYVKGDSEKIEMNAYAQDKYVYATSNLVDGYIREEYPELTDELEEIKKVLDEAKDKYEIEAENYDYVIEALKKAIINSLDSKKMSKESSTIRVNGKDLKVTQYTYTLDEDALKKTYESIFNSLLEDDEFLDKMAKLMGEEKSSVEDTLNEMKDEANENLELEEEMKIHIYTNGVSNKTRGFGIEYDEQDYFHFYTDGENAESILYDDSEAEIVKLVSVRKDNVDEVTVTYEDEGTIKAYVREISETVIDCDIEVTIEDKTVKGTVYLSGEVGNTNIDGKYKLKIEYDNQYIGVEGTYGIESKEKLEKANISKVLREEDLDQEEALKRLEEIINKDKAFKKLYDFIKEVSVANSYNEYDMKSIHTVEDVKKVLNSYEGTVLYVGSPSASTSNNVEVDVLSKLKRFQYTYDFVSYYYDYTVMPKEISDILDSVSLKCFDGNNSSGAPFTDCTTADCVSICLDYPAVYFIKDGKIVSGLRGRIDDASLLKELEAIGLAKAYSNNEV